MSPSPLFPGAAPLRAMVTIITADLLPTDPRGSRQISIKGTCYKSTAVGLCSKLVFYWETTQNPEIIISNETRWKRE